MKVFANRIIYNGNKHCVLVAANSVKEAVLTLNLGVICGTVEHDYPKDNWSEIERLNYNTDTNTIIAEY